MIPRTGQTAKSLALAGALCALLSPGVAHAQGTVSVTPTVTRTGSLFHYSYTVTNGTGTEQAIISFQSALGAAVINTAAPAGFFTSYDAGNGFISFAPTSNADAGTFAAGSTVGAFTFDSPFSAGATQFSALSIFGDETTGPTQAPTVVPAPEPGALVSLGAGVVGLTGLAARRRRATVNVS